MAAPAMAGVLEDERPVPVHPPGFASFALCIVLYVGRFVLPGFRRNPLLSRARLAGALRIMAGASVRGTETGAWRRATPSSPGASRCAAPCASSAVLLVASRFAFEWW